MGLAPALVAGLVKGGASLLAGSKRDKEAKKNIQRTERYSDAAIQAGYKDQERAIQYRDDDQRRIDANYEKYGPAGQLDLKQLRDKSMEAGFNPLTVLGATGGAGFQSDGGPQVLTTPFISFAENDWRKAELVAGVGRDKIETAGYVGDAIGAGFDAWQATKQQQQENAFESARISMLGASIRQEQQANGISPFGGGATRRVDASPATVAGGYGLPASGSIAAGNEAAYGNMGFEVQKGKYTKSPLWAKTVGEDGFEYVIANPDLDNEWLEATIIATPFQRFRHVIEPYLTDDKGVGYARKALNWASNAKVVAPFGSPTSAGGYMGGGASAGWNRP